MSETIDARVHAKRDTILETALQFFAREGFHNADVQQIADTASVGKGTIYRHFENKEGLFLAAAKYCLRKLREHLETQLGDESQVGELANKEGILAILRRIAVSCAEFYQRRPEAVEIMLLERAEFRDRIVPSHLLFRAESRDGFDELLQQAIARGELREVDVIETSNAFGDLIFGSVVNGHLGGDDKNLVRRVEHAVDIFCRGLLPESAAP